MTGSVFAENFTAGSRGQGLPEASPGYIQEAIGPLEDSAGHLGRRVDGPAFDRLLDEPDRPISEKDIDAARVGR